MSRAALVAAALGVGLASGAAPPGPRPAAGLFLYAMPGLGGSVFETTVILLVDHDESGSLGLIVNKPTRMTLRDALEVDGAERLETPLYFGGPVAIDGMMALLRADRAPEEGRRVIGDVYFTTARGALEKALAQGDADRRVRVYAGYSGWGPGQLQGEIDRGSWVVAPANPDAVFLEDSSELWDDVYLLMDRIEARRLDGNAEVYRDAAKYRPA